jgi:hypothetical protein
MRRTRGRRRGRRAAAAGAALAALVFGALSATGSALADSAPADPTLGRPSVFAGLAAASGVFQNTDRNNGLSAVVEPVHSSFPDAMSVFGSDTFTARGSVYYPGATVAGLGSLICVAGGPCNLPPYPLDAIADATHPTVSVQLPGPLGGAAAPIGLQSGKADARVGITGVASNALVAGYGATGAAAAGAGPLAAFARQAASLLHTPGQTALATNPVVQVGSLEAHTSQSFQHTSTLVTHAESRVSGIDILGGMIHIDGIFATSTFENDGQGVHRHQDDVTVSGVSVAGQPARIDANGITITGAAVGKPVLDALNASLASALAAAGIQLHVLGRTTGRSSLFPRRCSAGEVDGLQIYLPVNLNSVPLEGDVYHTEIVLGGACTDATASADRVGAAAADSGAGASASTPAVSGSGESGPAGLAAGSVPSNSGDLTTGSGPAAVPAAAASRNRSTARRAGLLEGDLRGSLVGHRIELLYLSFTLAFLAICLGVRPFLPARLPGGPE